MPTTTPASRDPKTSAADAPPASATTPGPASGPTPGATPDPTPRAGEAAGPGHPGVEPAVSWVRDNLAGKIDARPRGLDDTEWDILDAHVNRGESFSAIARRYSEPWTALESFAHEAARKLGLALPRGMDRPVATICGRIALRGLNGEPLACGYERGHAGRCAWDSLPNFPRGDRVADPAAARPGDGVGVGVGRIMP